MIALWRADTLSTRAFLPPKKFLIARRRSRGLLSRTSSSAARGTSTYHKSRPLTWVLASLESPSRR
jgi:hypothetical protein